MPTLFVKKGDYAVTSDDILDTLAGGVASGNIKWKSGTAFFGELDHANTGNRVYTFPNASGTVPLISNTQTWTGLQTFNSGTLKVTNILGATSPNEIRNTSLGWDILVDAGGNISLVFNNVINYEFDEEEFDFGLNYQEGGERGDPAAPAANRGRLYFRDNGAGKTQLVVRFATGAIQVIATQP